jgi:hypothetical protein
MTKYKVLKWEREIRPVEVASETPGFVTLPNRNRREAKLSYYHAYFDTWDEAYKFLHDRVSNELSCAHSRVIRLQAELERVEKLSQ